MERILELMQLLLSLFIETLPMVFAEIDRSRIGSLNSQISFSFSWFWEPSMLMLLRTGEYVLVSFLN